MTRCHPRRLAHPAQAGFDKWGDLAAPKPEKLMVHSMLPLAVRALVSSTALAIQNAANVSNAAAMAVTPQQWADCSTLVRALRLPWLVGSWSARLMPCLLVRSLARMYRATSYGTLTCMLCMPWLQGASLGVLAPAYFPHPPELCAFVTDNSMDLGIPFPVTLPMLGDLGLKLNATVAAAFLEAVGGRFAYYQ